MLFSPAQNLLPVSCVEMLATPVRSSQYLKKGHPKVTDTSNSTSLASFVAVGISYYFVAQIGVIDAWLFPRPAAMLLPPSSTLRPKRNQSVVCTSVRLSASANVTAQLFPPKSTCHKYVKFGVKRLFDFQVLI